MNQPETTKGGQVGVRLDPAEMQALDDLRNAQTIPATRTDAARFLILTGLGITVTAAEAEPKKGRKK